MRKLRTIICVLVLAVTIPAAICLKRGLPPDTQPMIEKKYGGWSGVLRLCVCEGWPTGSGGTAAWINRCAESYERRHPGVYVQPEYVAADALSAEGFQPDLVIFAPGTVDGEALASLDVDPPVRDGLPRDDRAVPVMLGGYMWAYDAGQLEGIPDTWQDAGGAPASPPDDDQRLWTAALLALCSARYLEDAAPELSLRGGLELGLAEEPTPPTASPAPDAATLSCRLPEAFAPSADAWQAFVNGEAAALVVTPREIRRLEALSDQGKGPDWRLDGANAVSFTDQVLYIGAVNQADADKLALCREFIAHLLSADCQGALNRVGAFSVTDAPSGYPAGDSLSTMEQYLLSQTLLVPGPFDGDWRQDAIGIVREFWRDSREPAAILALLSERIRQ